MNLLNKLTLKNLKLNKKRTIVTIIGIILSTALITAVSSMYASGIKSLINYETTIKGNYHVAFYDVDINDIGIFKNNRNIEKINITKDIGYSKINSKNEYKPYVFVKGFTRNSLNDLAVNLLEGRLPLDENEIVIPNHLKTNGRVSYNVGDNITLDIGKRVTNDGYELKQSNPYNVVDDDDEDSELEEKIIDVKTKTYKIVGIIERPADSVEPYSAPGYTLITYLNSNSISGKVDVFTNFNEKKVKETYEITANILGVDSKEFKKLSKDNLSEAESKGLSEELDKVKYEFKINSYLVKLQTNPIGNSGIAGLSTVIMIVIIIIIFTSVFCIKNSFDISITEKIKQYGMLRSIGATKKQVKKNVFYEATVLGLIGIPIGILSGILAAFILIIISNHFLDGMFDNNLKLVFSFSFISILIAFVLAVITIYFSAFRGARRASLVSPIESIRNSANISINGKKLKCPKIIKKIFGIGGEISYKNIKRNRKKYRTTVFSLVISVFTFIALSGFMAAAFKSIEAELEVTENNISIFVRDYNDYKKYEDLIQLENIDNFTIQRNSNFYVKDAKLSKEYIEWTNADYEVEDNVLTVLSIGNYQYKKYLKELNLDYDNLKEKAILISNLNISHDEDDEDSKWKNINILGYKSGDIIKGLIDDTDEFQFTIGAVTKEKPFGLKYGVGLFLIVNDELYDSIPRNSKFMHVLIDSSNANKLQDDIDLYLQGDAYSLSNMDENVKMMNNLYTLLAIFLYGFIIVISLIGITNIFNTITTNMELRKPEFAMLKSVGMTRSEFSRMIRLESIFIGLKALIYGIPIGTILSYIIFNVLADGEDINFTLPYTSIIISISVVFILISIIMKYSINKINKQNTIETIRNENI